MHRGDLMNPGNPNTIEIMNVRQVAPQVFEADSEDLGFRSLFGGQVLGQSVIAASHTVDKELSPHSMHAYFLRQGQPDQAVQYHVTITRNGRSFCTREVSAKQNGSTIFCMTASFQRQEEGPNHQAKSPKVPGPEGLLSEEEHIRLIQMHLPADRRAKLTAERSVEIRIVNRPDPLRPTVRAPIKHAWFRVKSALPENPNLHTALLAYASDFGISLTGLQPHGLSISSPDVRVASLDHAIWFHRTCHLDDWHLYEMESTSAASGRSFNRGQIFTRDGTLVASVAQEALLRQKKQ